jgi:hypothetical protein
MLVTDVRKRKERRMRVATVAVQDGRGAVACLGEHRLTERACYKRCVMERERKRIDEAGDQQLAERPMSKDRSLTLLARVRLHCAEGDRRELESVLDQFIGEAWSGDAQRPWAAVRRNELDAIQRWQFVDNVATDGAAAGADEGDRLG